MIDQNPLYQILSSLYSSHTLANSAVPGVIQAMQYPFNRAPLQIQGYGARSAPTPKQPDSNAGGLPGLMLAGASLFQKGGPLASYGAESSAGSFWGNIAGQSNSGYFNTNTDTGLNAYLSATNGL